MGEGCWWVWAWIGLEWSEEVAIRVRDREGKECERWRDYRVVARGLGCELGQWVKIEGKGGVVVVGM